MATKTKLHTIVIIFTISTILFTLIVAGIAINLVLSDLYEKRAQSELQHAYKLLNERLGRIEKDLTIKSHHISTNKLVIATTHLVNRYQNKNNYQPLIFDNDKKNVAVELLQHISLTTSSQAAVYDVNGELIAYAEYNNQDKHAWISTYKNGKRYYQTNDGLSNKWQHRIFLSATPTKIESLQNKKNSTTYYDKNIYRSNNGRLSIENSRLIKRTLPGGNDETLGAVKFFVFLDKDFFKKEAIKSGVSVTVSHNNVASVNLPNRFLSFDKLEQSSILFGNSQNQNKTLQPHTTHFIQSYRLPTIEGEAYLVISQPKENLVSTLNKTRASLTSIFFIAAFTSIIFGVFLLNKAIVKPINELVGGASLNPKDGYPKFPINFTSQEISKLGEVLNNMVDTIKLRGSELAENEQLLKNTQTLAQLGSWRYDHVKDKLAWSDEAYNIFQQDKKLYNPNYDDFFNIIHPEDKEYVEKSFSESIKYHAPYDIHHRLLSKDGSTRYVREYCETKYNTNGNPTISSGIVQDVTEQTIKDEQIRRTQKMDALDQLTGGIAHDFNNSLSVILGFTELLKLDSNLVPEHADYINEIYLAGERARKLTAKLLAFTRKNVSFACSADINMLLLEEQHMLEKTLTVRIKLELDLADELWYVHLDPDELEDSVLNMSINAMHAMPDGGELVLTTRNVRLDTVDVSNMDIAAGEYVLLTLTDTGVGMDAETAQRVFEPFYSTKKNKGTGLGMSQVYGFVKRTGGTIMVYSEKNHGTRISIYLPRYLLTENTKSEQEQKEINELEDLTGQATILVVDDEAALRHLTKEILSSMGYKVLCAETGKEALKILETESVDLLLSDVVMPGMSGYELASEVAKLYPNIKIQMASGFADDSDITSADDEFHRQQLQKPFSSIDLLKKIRHLLNKDGSEHDLKVG